MLTWIDIRIEKYSFERNFFDWFLHTCDIGIPQVQTAITVLVQRIAQVGEDKYVLSLCLTSVTACRFGKF